MQRCKPASGLCKGAKVKNSFRSQVSGSGYQVQVRVRGEIQILNLYPNLNT